MKPIIDRLREIAMRADKGFATKEDAEFLRDLANALLPLYDLTRELVAI
jgi:hypothetical protein